MSGREARKGGDGRGEEDLLNSLGEDVKEWPRAGVRTMQPARQRTVTRKGWIMGGRWHMKYHKSEQNNQQHPITEQSRGINEGHRKTIYHTPEVATAGDLRDGGKNSQVKLKHKQDTTQSKDRSIDEKPSKQKWQLDIGGF